MKELLKFANEELISDILTVIDHLELALQHTSGDETKNPLAEGVELARESIDSGGAKSKVAALAKATAEAKAA